LETTVNEDEILTAIRARVVAGRPTDWAAQRQLPQPVSEGEIRNAVSVIGYRIPPLLHRIYTEVANGGIGPFGGIEGLTGDGYSSIGSGLLHGYLEHLRAQVEPGKPPPPPRGVVFLCDFGCAQWALLDCRHPQGRMWWWEEGDRYKLNLTLPEWFAVWLAGQSVGTWTRPALRRLDHESWSRDRTRGVDRRRAAVHPDQLSLW
jgi:hypothetical protein